MQIGPSLHQNCGRPPSKPAINRELVQDKSICTVPWTVGKSRFSLTNQSGFGQTYYSLADPITAHPNLSPGPITRYARICRPEERWRALTENIARLRQLPDGA